MPISPRPSCDGAVYYECEECRTTGLYCDAEVARKDGWLIEEEKGLVYCCGCKVDCRIVEGEE